MFDPTFGAAEVEALVAEIAAVCERLEPDKIPASEVAATQAALARGRRLLEGACTRMARRVAEAEVWRGGADRNAAEFLARTGGMTRQAAEEQLATSRRLAELDATDAAVRQGELSAAQATAVADGADADPDAEQALLQAAAAEPLSGLRDQARRVKAAADPDPQWTWRRIHGGRHIRRWTDAEGAYNLVLRGPAEAGAIIDARLAPTIDRLFTTARAQGRHEPAEAYAFDALIELLDRPAGDVAPKHVPRGRETKVIVHVDGVALKRGVCEAGERCEIAGVGPVPVATVRALLPEAFVAVVIADATDIQAVAHLGRSVTRQAAHGTRGSRLPLRGPRLPGAALPRDRPHPGLGHYAAHQARRACVVLPLPPPGQDPPRLQPPRPTRQPRMAPPRHWTPDCELSADGRRRRGPCRRDAASGAGTVRRPRVKVFRADR